MMQLFHNIQAMHWNEKAGVFVTEHDGETQGAYMDTFQSGYTLEALRIFQRAVDGLPVGYANGKDTEGLKTDDGQAAIQMIKKQADFIMANLINSDGLVYQGWDVASVKAQQDITLNAQLGAIRGLTAAFLATKDLKYRDAARSIYTAMDNHLWNETMMAYKTSDKTYRYDAFTVGGVSAVLRLALTSLSNTNNDREKPKALDRETIMSRYENFFRQIINGPKLDQGMQASEFWDTGDLYREDDQTGNTDKDTVPQIQAGHGKYGIAPILLPVEVVAK